MPKLLSAKANPVRWMFVLLPTAALAAVFALGVPGAGSGAPCSTDGDCPDGEACGADVCESVAGGCGGESSGVEARQPASEAQALVTCMGCNGEAMPTKLIPACPPNFQRGDACKSEGAQCRWNAPTVGETTCYCEKGIFNDLKWACAERTFDPYAR